jgi:hypothetical protein
VYGVRAFAYAAHAIERGNAHAGGEVAVGAAAYSGFLDFPFDVAGDLLSFFAQRRDSGGALHGEAVDVAGHF